MKPNKYNPTITLLNYLEPDLPIRRRNLSLGSHPTPPPNPQKSVSPQHAAQPAYTSRKNKLLLKMAKFKNLKGNAILCQENISRYNALKKEVTSKYLSPIRHSHEVQNTRRPELSIKNLGIAVNCSLRTNFRKDFERKNIKTEIQSPHRLAQSKIYPSLGPIKRGLIKKQLIQSAFRQPGLKKYSQMSLRQIAEVQQAPRYTLLLKLRQLKSLPKQKRYSRRASDDYSLQGW